MFKKVSLLFVVVILLLSVGCAEEAPQEIQDEPLVSLTEPLEIATRGNTEPLATEEGENALDEEATVEEETTAPAAEDEPAATGDPEPEATIETTEPEPPPEHDPPPEEEPPSEEPSSTGTGSFAWPTASQDILRPYGMDKWDRLHMGIDIKAEEGDSVYAADTGTVVLSKHAGDYGQAVAIDHGNGFITMYAQLSERLVSVDNVVQKGDIIAKCGSMSHLHFEIRTGGERVAPEEYLL